MNPKIDEGTVKETETVDLTPTWSAVLPILVTALEIGTDEGVRSAKKELGRMARIMDKLVEEREGVRSLIQNMLSDTNIMPGAAYIEAQTFYQHLDKLSKLLWQKGCRDIGSGQPEPDTIPEGEGYSLTVKVQRNRVTSDAVVLHVGRVRGADEHAAELALKAASMVDGMFHFEAHLEHDEGADGYDTYGCPERIENWICDGR